MRERERERQAERERERENWWSIAKCESCFCFSVILSHIISLVLRRRQEHIIINIIVLEDIGERLRPVPKVGPSSTVSQESKTDCATPITALWLVSNVRGNASATYS